MPYSASTVSRINTSPRTLGNKLGRRAVAIDFSVLRIAKATGATRQTVYNWLFGGTILSPYKPLVVRLLAVLAESKSSDIAWRKTCQEFQVDTQY